MKTIDELAVKLLDGSFFLEEAVELLEKGMINGALQRTEGNQSEASKMLGIHRNTLQRKMTEYQIDGRRKKPVPKPVQSASTSRPIRTKRPA
jgi:DNA-binding NtrC family response regulator